MVLGELRRVGLSPDSSAAIPGRTLADAPSAVVYHAVTNLSTFQNPHISSILHAHIPPNAIVDWPCDPPPPGLLMLAMDADVPMRRWAESQVSKCTKVPMSKEDFGRPYQKALQLIAQALTHASSASASSGAVSSSDTFSFSFASDPTDLWSSFCAVVFRTIPVEMLTLIINNNTDIRRVVTGHLHDTGPRQWISSFLRFVSLNGVLYPHLSDSAFVAYFVSGLLERCHRICPHPSMLHSSSEAAWTQALGWRRT